MIDRLPVVNEFPEVFPDEILDVPPEREVAFSIEEYVICFKMIYVIIWYLIIFG